MGAEQLKLDRRRLIVLGAASVLPACAAGGGDPSEWDPGSGNGLGGGSTGSDNSSSSGNTSTGSTSTGGTSTSSSSTSSTSSSGHTSSSSSSSSSTSSSGHTSSSSSSSSSTSSTSGGTTCPTPANSQRLNFSQYASLQNSGGSASFSGSGFSDSSCQQPNIIVVNNGGKFSAFSASCTHACCIVKVKGSELYCNCHGATFNISTGAVTGGPASYPLDVLQVCADSTGVTVTW